MTRHRYRTIRNRLLAWHSKEGRTFEWRTAPESEYRVVITESLLQQTRAETVAARREGFFTRLPDWASLRQAEQHEVEEALKPFGLWRRRAISLKRLAEEMRKYDDRLPRRRVDLERLPGVGQYIANAIEMMVFGRALPLIDVNMARLLGRLADAKSKADLRYDPVLQSASRKLIGRKHARETNFACLDLAAIVCVANEPKCAICPLTELCSYYSRNRAQK